MKKLNLNMDGIKEMLTKEQMKKISGGYEDPCDSECDFGEDACPQGLHCTTVSVFPSGTCEGPSTVNLCFPD